MLHEPRCPSLRPAFDRAGAGLPDLHRRVAIPDRLLTAAGITTTTPGLVPGITAIGIPITVRRLRPAGWSLSLFARLSDLPIEPFLDSVKLSKKEASQSDDCSHATT